MVIIVLMIIFKCKISIIGIYTDYTILKEWIEYKNIRQYLYFIILETKSPNI